MQQIAHLEGLISDYVGQNKSIVGTKITNLIAPGENYMSEIVKILVTVKNHDTGLEEDLHLVAKLVIDNDLLGDGNTVQITKNEVIFYKVILPTLQDFLRRHNLPSLDFFPQFVAGRLNLDGSEIADRNAVLVLEDLRTKGYTSFDRLLGFDLYAAKLVLKDLAKFHAVPLALRLLEPELFKSKIQANSPGFKANVSEPQDGDFAFPLLSVFPLMAKILKNDDKYSSAHEDFEKFSKRMNKIFETHPEQFFSQLVADSFQTLTHHDIWINNTMQIIQNGIPVKNVFLDFQMCECNSPVADLLFFLTSSIQLPILIDHFDHLIEYYYENFCDVLKEFGCYNEEYAYDKFLEGIKRGCAQGLIQCMFMILTVTSAKKGESFEQNRTDIRPEDVPRSAKDRLGFLFVEASKRGWLY